jgi:hypothetical protein
MLHKILDRLRSVTGRQPLTDEARQVLRLDAAGVPDSDPGIDVAVREALAWMGRAQDNNALGDGGVAREYSLLSGWATSYPETTGYIIPTLLDCARIRRDVALRERARRMLDWFVEIQLEGGGYQGGRIDSEPVVPVTFNTGQILLGLAAGVAEFGDTYRPAMRAAGDWLRDSLDPDGCWRRHPTPFAAAGEKAYETHVSWGLFEAARQDPDRGYGEAGLKQVRWALTKQRENGWFDDCCLDDPAHPLTHTIGYVLRGVLEAHRFSGESDLLDASQRTADALIPLIDASGFLPGRLDSAWRPTERWACLTGSVQIAHCLMLLDRLSGDQRYRDPAFRLTSYVRRTMRLDGSDGVRGGIKGSFPVDGAYGSFQYLNWAAKFFIDANLLEAEIREQDVPAS